MSPRKPPAPRPAPKTEETARQAPDEPRLQAEELEERIAPRLSANHNETLLGEEG
jgi:hypothetical protein